MEEAASVLKAAYEEDGEHAEKMIAALELLQSEAPLSASAARDWKGWSLKYSLALFSVPTGTLQALIGSGDLGLVVSQDLRETLITEYAAINTYQSWIYQVLDQALPNSKDVMLEYEVLRIQAAGKIVSLDSFRRSPRWIASHQVQLNLLQNMMSAIQSMRVAVDNIHAAVEKELEQRVDSANE